MDTIETIVITIMSGLIGGYVSYYFSEQTEKYKFVQLQRQKAEAVARLFSRWIKYRGKEANYLNEKELFDYFEELNQMTFELSLWISDEKLLTDIMLRLQNHQEAKDVRSLIGDIRKLILDKPFDKFNVQEITVWPK